MIFSVRESREPRISNGGAMRQALAESAAF